MDNKKTLHQLYSKGIYRFLKIVYLFTYTLIILFEFTIASDYLLVGFVKMLLVTALIFELIRRSFYYVITGTITPKKQ